MRIEHFLLALIVIYAITVWVRRQNRTEDDERKPSWMVRGWNASGAPQVESTRVGPAVAELAGRGIGRLTGKTQQAAKAKWDDRKARATERAEAQREVIAEVAAAAKQKAFDRARQVTDFVGRRWNSHRPNWSRRADTRERDEQGGTDPGEQGNTETVTAAAQCRDCGTRHTVTIPAGEDGQDVTCDCGKTLHFFRRRPTDPAPEGARPAEVQSPDQTQPPQEDARPKLRIVPKEDTDMTVNTADTTPAAEAAPLPSPPDWGAIAGRVANFEPETDADLINFMSSEIAGMCAYSDAYEALFETCTRSLGLDQRSVQGLGEFGEKVVELTREMALAHRRFVQVYEEVIRMVADGTQMPHNGRFFSGDVAV